LADVVVISEVSTIGPSIFGIMLRRNSIEQILNLIFIRKQGKPQAVQELSAESAIDPNFSNHNKFGNCNYSRGVRTICGPDEQFKIHSHGK